MWAGRHGIWVLFGMSSAGGYGCHATRAVFRVAFREVVAHDATFDLAGVTFLQFVEGESYFVMYFPSGDTLPEEAKPPTLTFLRKITLRVIIPGTGEAKA